jgi:hypothetical protein
MCPTYNQDIPKAYVRQRSAGMPTLHMLFIGYSGHGKTCYLASLLHQVFHGPAPERWPGFYPLGLNQRTLAHIHEEYVAALNNMVLPPRTGEFLPNALVLHLDSVPQRMVRGLPLPAYRQADMMVTMHDIGGEAFETQQNITERLPLIAGVSHIVLLIDLTRVREDAESSHRSVVQQMTALLNTTQIALEQLGAAGRKGCIVCFTKADRMWGKDDYGPLAVRPALGFPDVSAMPAYSKNMTRQSDEISRFMHTMYPAFANMLESLFKPVRYTAVSSLGHEPDGTQMQVFSPISVFDPVFWYMKMEGLM